MGLSFRRDLVEVTELFIVLRPSSSALNPLKVMNLGEHGQGADIDSPDYGVLHVSAQGQLYV